MRALLAILAVLALTAPLDARFDIATAPYRFAFPRDHAAHFGYQSEWWYFTGHLRASDGRRFGYELTFFRYGLRPGRTRITPGESRWHGAQVYPAHFAITDERDGQFVHYERFVREALGVAGASDRRLAVGAGSWWLRGMPIHLHAHAEGNALDLVQHAEKAPAIHGHGGVSRKSACPSCASHYYSLTRLATVGKLAYRGVTYAVEGTSWMDHEFGTDELGPEQAGWDWFSIQLGDGREVMLYRLRRKDGGTTPQSSGSLIETDGTVRYLPLAEFSIEAIGEWNSPHTHARYPSGWRVRIPAKGLDMTILPTVRDQELADRQIGVAYWEGACDVSGNANGRAIYGAAYVELTGYAGGVSP